MHRLLRIILSVFLVCGLFAPIAEAGPVQRRTHPDFTVPPKLRPRVNFWIDVFTRYGKTQMIVHHREYPQIRFGIIDVTAQAAGLDDDDIAKLKKTRSDQVTQSLQALFRRLAAGGSPQNDFEQSVVDQMAFLGPGVSKYQDMIDKDLIRTQSGIREKYAEAVRRSGRYLPIMQDIFRDRGLPVELTRLPFIESSFDYKAYSSVGAAGIWQFMRKTGMLYMKVNNTVDERRDPIEATKGAARYLSEAYSKLGNWPLAITSYNHGVYGVSKKVREAGTSNLADIIEDPNNRAFGFASTNFFPEFLAALEVFDDYERYFPGLKLEPPLDLTEVQINSPTSVHYISRKLNVSIDDLRAVNYAVSDKVWAGRASLPSGYSLKVPTSTGVSSSNLTLAEHVVPPSVKASSSVYSGTVYRVRKGDTLGSIAKRYRVSVATLKQTNNLKSDVVSVGQSLLIKQNIESAIVKSEAEASPQPKRRTYKVQKGDNLWLIAKKLGKNVADIKHVNGMKKNNLREGQVLKIP
ncbi:MAG: LysM peptidoglycan-binding domain-containing protein [Deltaproteobacteria bacterium]|nr:LysM peptidoglycan-binding domain-containing protein [Deltaproteobacteria bacterium]